MPATTEVKELPVLTLTLAPTGFDRDMTKENWQLLEDVKGDIPEGISTLNLELIPFLNEGESSVNGEEMKNRSKDLKAHHGQKLAELLLRNQSQIPKEWRQFYLAFPGTVWRSPGGGRDVPGLGWVGGRWSLSFLWLGSDWRSVVRLVRFRES